MSKTEVVKGGIGLEEPEGASPLVKAEEDSTAVVDVSMLQDMGFITPIASPEQLRAAFAYQQRMMAAILDENDYLYIASWDSDGKRKQKVTADRGEAVALAEKFEHLNSSISAKPLKSGIVKLARALGITAERMEVQGLPSDPKAIYSYVEYKATHERTAKSEVGVGWCDKSERGGKISSHDVIATADTRAYNRAILRLAGFGDVSADEIVAGASDNPESVPDNVPETPKQKELEELPAEDADEVVAASRAWAEAVARRAEEKGDYLAPKAKQDTRSAREMRAKARRGSQRAASQMGTLGIDWEGTACDSLGSPAFTVYAPPIKPPDIEAQWVAADKAKAEVDKKLKGEKPKANGEAKKGKGWNLSGKGSDKDDENLSAAAEEAADKKVAKTNIPTPSPNAEPISLAQAKKISLLLKDVFDDKSDMVAWLKDNCHVGSTKDIHGNQYEAAVKALKTLKKEK